MKPERRFRTRVNHKLDARIHIQAMGSMYTNGTPDVYYEQTNILWLEYKWIPYTPRSNVLLANTKSKKDMVKPLQMLWLRRCYKNGHRVGIVVGSPAGAAWVCPMDKLIEPHRFILTDQDVADLIEQEVLG